MGIAFGLTVLEARLHGCVPLVSDFNGYRGTVDDGRNGILLKTYAGRVPDLLWLCSFIIVAVVSYESFLGKAISAIQVF